MSYDPNTDFRIIGTAEDAILAKQAATEAKYYEDPFCAAFAHAATLRTNGGNGPGMGRKRYFQPIIKRGTHARVCVMDRALTSFLKFQAAEPMTKAVQVVVLGAGKDTSYFRWIAKSLMGLEDYRSPGTSSSPSAPLPPLPRVKWFEVDHSSVIKEKVKCIQTSRILSQCCPDLQPIPETPGGYAAEETFLRLIPADLREDPQTWLPTLKLKPKLPTLFISECVFMYMPVDSTERLLRALGQSMDKAWVALYEPILGESSQFGKMMAQNLVQANVALPDSSLLKTRTLSSQLEKLVQRAGFQRAVGADLWQAYQSVVTPQQRQQANRAEFLDELEEWILIMRHYCIVIATNTNPSSNADLTSVGPDSPMGFLESQSKILTAGDD